MPAISRSDAQSIFGDRFWAASLVEEAAACTGEAVDTRAEEAQDEAITSLLNSICANSLTAQAGVNTGLTRSKTCRTRLPTLLRNSDASTASGTTRNVRPRQDNGDRSKCARASRTSRSVLVTATSSILQAGRRW